MDSIAPRVPALEALRAKAAETIEAFQRAASVSYLQDDPAKEQLNAMALAMATLMQICEVSDATQKSIAASLDDRAEDVANSAIDRVHASGVEMINQLVPRLTEVVERTTHQRAFNAKLRTVLGGTVALVVALAGMAAGAYSAGYATGKSRGEIIGHTVSAAMASGPAAAGIWSTLMAYNNPVAAMAACEKGVSRDVHGRKFCALPVWIDPPSPAGS